MGRLHASEKVHSAPNTDPTIKVRKEVGEKVTDAIEVTGCGWPQLQHHDPDDDGDDAVAEGLQTSLRHVRQW